MPEKAKDNTTAVSETPELSNSMGVQEPKDENAVKDTTATEKGNSEPNNSDAKLYTEEELEEIIKARVAREQKNARKQVEEAEKLAKMNEDEKRAYEFEKLRKELDEYKAKEKRSDMAKEASKILAEKGLIATDSMLDYVVREDAESTQSAIEDFENLINGIVQREVKKALTGQSPRVKVNSSKTYTKDDILKIKDTKERKAKIAENIELFK